MNDIDQISDEDADPIILQDVKTDLDKMSQIMMKSKMDEQTLLMKSAMDGGPSSIQEGLYHLVQKAKVSLRAISREAGVGRKAIEAMLEGRKEMPREVFDAVYACINRKRPDFFKQ